MNLRKPPFLIALVLLASFAAQGLAVAQVARTLPKADTLYETNYLSNTVDRFSLRGSDLGVFKTITFPTGLAFDRSGNLFVSSDDPAGYSVEKFATDGTVSVFANSGLSQPHGLAFDQAGESLCRECRH